MVIDISGRYILSITHLDAKNIYHIITINKFQFIQFQDKWPFSLGPDENDTVFNGITNVYNTVINIKYAANRYGINSGFFSIVKILKTGCDNIINNAIWDNNLLENVSDHMKYSINCIMIIDW